MLTFDATEQINEVSRTTRTTRTTTQVITRYFGRWPQTKMYCLFEKTETNEKEAVVGLFLSVANGRST